MSFDFIFAKFDESRISNCGDADFDFRSFEVGGNNLLQNGNSSLYRLFGVPRSLRLFVSLFKVNLRLLLFGSCGGGSVSDAISRRVHFEELGPSLLVTTDKRKSHTQRSVSDILGGLLLKAGASVGERGHAGAPCGGAAGASV